MDKKDLHWNIGRTEILVSGVNLDLLKKSERTPVLTVLKEWVEMRSSVRIASHGGTRTAVVARPTLSSESNACMDNPWLVE